MLSINATIDDVVTSERYYQLLLVISTLEPLKANIVMTLAHIAPSRISGTELTMMLGYSRKARTIYRGVLDDLEEHNYIILERQGKQYSIGINNNHPVMNELIQLSMSHGEDMRNSLYDLLEEVD